MKCRSPPQLNMSFKRRSGSAGYLDETRQAKELSDLGFLSTRPSAIPGVVESCSALDDAGVLMSGKLEENSPTLALRLTVSRRVAQNGDRSTFKFLVEREDRAVTEDQAA